MREFAIELHERLCRHEHTEMCGWYYEIHEGVHDWSRYEHKTWLKKAQKLVRLLPGMTQEEIMKVVKAIREI